MSAKITENITSLSSFMILLHLSLSTIVKCQFMDNILDYPASGLKIKADKYIEIAPL